jgi:POT family proton-dependent oligopeptide transporter
MPPTGSSGGDTERKWLGHPRGLSTLFFTEMWERFSYYGMRAFLVLFMTAPVAAGGLGFNGARAGIIYGMYTSMVYMLSVPGGWIADRFLGQQRAVFFGGIGIMLGHLCLAIPAGPTFYLGLCLVALGTGLLKPNISTIVGQLYGKEDKRRESGFSIFYMGINIGAFVAPLVCGTYLAESESFKRAISGMGIHPQAAWHFAFGSAAVGMLFGLIQYWHGRRFLGEAGRHPTPPKDAREAGRNRRMLMAVLAVFLGLPIVIALLAVQGAITLTPEIVGKTFDYLLPLTALVVFGLLFTKGVQNRDETRRLLAIFVFFIAAAVFWGCFEQAGSTLTLFARDHTNRVFLGNSFGASTFQSLNAIFVVILAPIFAWWWLRLAKHNREPATPTKFGFGMFFVGLGFLIMVPAAKMVMGGSLVGPQWLTMLYLIHTVGEMCLSPVGLAAMTRLAPVRWGGLVLGIWFLASSMGNFMAGRAVSLTESMQKDDFFLLMTFVPMAIGAGLWMLSKPIQRMLARNEAPAKAGH